MDNHPTEAHTPQPVPVPGKRPPLLPPDLFPIGEPEEEEDHEDEPPQPPYH